MKFVAGGAFTDPDAAARKLVEIANTTESVQDGRIYIELINYAFLAAEGSPAEFRSGIERAVEKGWPATANFPSRDYRNEFLEAEPSASLVIVP
jgi:hypothetical protein